MAPLLIYGAGGHAKVVADAAQLAGFDVQGFADDDARLLGCELLRWRVLATGVEAAIELCRERGAQFVVGIGSNGARARVYDAFRAGGVEAALVVHPGAVIAASASLGPGTVAFAGVVVNTEAEVGPNCILNTAASLDHNNRLGAHVHVAPGAHLGGTVDVGEGAQVGLGASVSNNLSIGAWTVVGAGSAVVRDLPPRVVAYGVPARVRRDVT